MVVNNPLTDLFFTGSSSFIIVTIGGYADNIIELRLKGTTTLDEDDEKASSLSSSTAKENEALPYWQAWHCWLLLLYRKALHYALQMVKLLHSLLH